METIVLNGKTYRLVPVEEDPYEAYRVPEKAEEPARTSPGPSKTGGVEKAVPVLSDYRERFKARKLRVSELVAPPKVYSKIGQVNGDLSKFGDMIIGEGLTEEY